MFSEDIFLCSPHAICRIASCSSHVRPSVLLINLERPTFLATSHPAKELTGAKCW